MDHHRFTNPASDDAEDNAFYAELTRRILLLTDEDDDDLRVKNKCVKRYNHRVGGGGGGGGGGGWSGNYFSWSENREVSVPGWMERLWAANASGTGVFIPRAGVHRSRRKHSKPKKNIDRGGRPHPAAAHKSLESLQDWVFVYLKITYTTKSHKHPCLQSDDKGIGIIDRKGIFVISDNT